MTMTATLERFVGSSLTMYAPPVPESAPLAGSGAQKPVGRFMIKWSQSGPRPWYVDLVELELNKIASLGKGWDGNRARPVTFRALKSSVEVLSGLLGEDSPTPQFFPLPDGGVQVEWLVAGNSVVIEIDGEGVAYVLATTVSDRDIADGIISRQDPQQMRCVAKFLSALSRQVKRAD